MAGGGCVGILANPMSGRDVRRVAAGDDGGSLATALAEGRRLLLDMVNANEIGGRDPIAEAFAEMLWTLEDER